MTTTSPGAASAIADARTSLGIELGSTRIKAVLVDLDGTLLASASHAWENQLVDDRWTYSLEAVEAGLQDAYARLVAEVEQQHGVRLERVGVVGVSAMMHGYLAFDAEGELLVPFRTWRNSSTGVASAALSSAFGSNLPLRWSAAHLLQAVIDGEAHVPDVRSLTTLAGYVHRRLTGEHVLGAGDASGMFPLDADGVAFDQDALDAFDVLAARHGARDLAVASLLPAVLPAGADAGALTEDGARLLDPSGGLQAGAATCPPEGDAGTGMVVTGAVGPGTGNVSVGTSIFAMLVLDAPLAHAHAEIDVVATPAGDPVAMVHCNNGASELDAWASLLGEFAAAAGHPLEPDAVFEALLRDALEADAEGLVAYNFLSGEHIVGLEHGRPLVSRTPGAAFTLGGFAKAQVLSAYATLRQGMRILEREGVRIDELVAHGGVFRTAGAAQALLAAALETPVVVHGGASEGGAWGMALLGAFRIADVGTDSAALAGWLQRRTGGDDAVRLEPDLRLVRDAEGFFARWQEAFELERLATEVIR